MATTVVKSIGSAGGRDYSTIQAWEDASPANLVTADQIWQGQCYNDSEFLINGTILTISGITTDSTRYIELTTGASQSFQDNASVRTNALAYNVSNGVGLRDSNNYGSAIVISTSYSRFNKLQIKSVATNQLLIDGSSGGNNVIMKDCIIQHGRQALSIAGNSTIINCNFFLSSASTTNFLVLTGSVIACNVIRTTDQVVGGLGVAGAYGSLLSSTSIFGFTSPASVTVGNWSASSSNNATDAVTGLPGSSNQHSVTFSSTSPFTNSSVASQNSITVTGTALSGNGLLDSTNAPNDISGTARPAGPTIGAWQLVTATTTKVFGWIFG